MVPIISLVLLYIELFHVLLHRDVVLVLWQLVTMRDCTPQAGEVYISSVCANELCQDVAQSR